MLRRVVLRSVIATVAFATLIICEEALHGENRAEEAENRIPRDRKEPHPWMKSVHRDPRDTMGHKHREEYMRHYRDPMGASDAALPEVSEEDIQHNPHLRRLYDDYKAGKFDKRHPAYRHLAIAAQRREGKSDDSKDSPLDPLTDIHQRIRRERSHPMRKIEEDLRRYRAGQERDLHIYPRDLRGMHAGKDYPGSRPRDLLNPNPEDAAPNEQNAKTDTAPNEQSANTNAAPNQAE